MATTDALIMLYVDTESIINLDPNDTSQLNLAAIAERCILASNHNDSANVPEGPGNPQSRRNFITDIKQNSQICWAGAVQKMETLPNDYVLVTGITPISDNIGIIVGNKVPENTQYNGWQPGSGDTHMDGMVRINQQPGGPNTEYNYTIFFTVCHGDTVKKNYRIDPKMRMT